MKKICLLFVACAALGACTAPGKNYNASDRGNIQAKTPTPTGNAVNF